VLNAPRPRSRLYTSARAYRKGAAALLRRGRGGAGVQKLEQALADMHPGSRAIAVPMARVGIYLTLKHLIRNGQKVILSPYTISDVVNMVLCAGGVPLFADIEEKGSCNIDATDVARLLSEHDDVGAVLVTHFYGLVCNIDPIVTACKKRGVPVVEDAAQAFGARIGGRRAGTIGHAGIFSFGLLKNVTSFLGGAILTSDPQLEARIREELTGFSDFSGGPLASKMAKGAAFDTVTNPLFFDTAIYWLFRYAYLHGLEFFKNQLDTDANPKAYASLPATYAERMSDGQAEIICDQLARCDRDMQARIANAALYHEGLKDLPDLVLPPLRTDGSHIYLYYPIQCRNRDRLALSMTKDLRDVQISHHRDCSAMFCFAAYSRDCPNADRAAREVIYLPTYPDYGKDQVTANIAAIRSFFRRANSWT
jgi:dTDP-4-amino-4,6-dideoxygalactose transaminase